MNQSDTLTKKQQYQINFRQKNPNYHSEYWKSKLTKLVICDYCNGFYKKSYMYKHQKKCNNSI
jgi:hypothetical protein